MTYHISQMSHFSAVVPVFQGSPSFHAQHSPLGAFFSFTCGLTGRRGGMAAELGKPAGQDLFIGVKDGLASDPTVPTVFPFFEGASDDPASAYLAQSPANDPHQRLELRSFVAASWRRRYGWATDTFEADLPTPASTPTSTSTPTAGTAGLTFSIYTPWSPIPDPDTASHPELAAALLPAVRAELTLDNTAGKTTRTIFFAIGLNQPGTRRINSGLGAAVTGFAIGRRLGLAATSKHPFKHFMRWTVSNGLADTSNPYHQLGNCPGFSLEVPAGEKRTLRLALGCHLDGTVTTGIEASYLYTRYHPNLPAVLSTALESTSFDAAVAASRKLDAELLASGLSPDQQFLLAHATRSYHGSTQLLDAAGRPFWVVNEGEYCMMNTLDLSVDHMFWELRHNPWVVRNLLENYLAHYSFVDQVKSRGADALLPGGLSFTHDMGVQNNFSPPGSSSYELPDLDALCFSHMTAEQLCNWTLMAATYINHTRDRDWALRHRHVFEALGESLLNRCGDGGIISFDSSRCRSGAEITTYDSLDHSLAQTRNNLYIAVKGWATFLAIRELMLASHDSSEAPGGYDAWLRYAHLAEQTIRSHADARCILPAVFETDNPGHKSQILPAVEGLLYPLAWAGGLLDEHGHFAGLVEVLRAHTLACLASGRNHFPDGGIRLSSTSDNSWLSKIFLFQHIAQKLGWVQHADFAKSDAAHVRWLTTGESAYWAMSDQFIAGVAKGSRYYPRCVTAVLWL
jgi:xylan 1,4-beta-xylosidase